MQYNISYSITALIIDVILLFIVGINYSSTNLVNKRFKYFLVASILMISFDIGTTYTICYASYIPTWLNMLLNSIYFLLGALVAMLFFYYCVSLAFKDTSAKIRRNYYIINLSVFGIYSLSILFNAFFGFYFSFIDDVYTKGVVYVLVNSVSIFYVIESIVIFILKRSMFNRRQIVCTCIFYVLFFLSFILQITLFPLILLTDLGCAIGALLVFFSIETPDYVKLMYTLNELNELKASLEIQVKNRTQELDAEKESYETLTLETLSSLAHVIDAKDHYTNGHSFRVAAYARGMAQLLGFSPSEQEQLYFAGLIHDVGKIGISEHILSKPGALTEEEYSTIKAHSALGGDILKGIKQYEIFEQVARSHHERFDGKGYPDKLIGEEIPYSARIVAICDSFDAMTSDRSYRKALTDEYALSELTKGKGTQFDPELVDVFLKLYNSYPDSIRNHISDLAIDVEDVD